MVPCHALGCLRQLTVRRSASSQVVASGVEADKQIFAPGAESGDGATGGGGDLGGLVDASCGPTGGSLDDGDEEGGSSGGRADSGGQCRAADAVRSLEPVFRVRFEGWRIEDRPERRAVGGRFKAAHSFSLPSP